MLPVRKILCPTDFSEPSLHALHHACELAAHFGAELHLLHVLPLMPPFPSDLLVVAVHVESDAERETRAAHLLQQIIKERVSHNVQVTYSVKMGYAANEIAAAAEEGNADLLVISTHGVTGWRHMAFGSVAETIVRLSRRPVLTIHAPANYATAQPGQTATAQRHASETM
ncbi:MAG TPA: universal stress protein [Abditibacteriaceae bacterium]|jgi:nucleotide-binding universal stress UspA family protein